MVYCNVLLKCALLAIPFGTADLIKILEEGLEAQAISKDDMQAVFDHAKLAASTDPLRFNDPEFYVHMTQQVLITQKAILIADQ